MLLSSSRQDLLDRGCRWKLLLLFSGKDRCCCLCCCCCCCLGKEAATVVVMVRVEGIPSLIIIDRCWDFSRSQSPHPFALHSPQPLEGDQKSSLTLLTMSKLTYDEVDTMSLLLLLGNNCMLPLLLALSFPFTCGWCIDDDDDSFSPSPTPISSLFSSSDAYIVCFAINNGRLIPTRIIVEEGEKEREEVILLLVEVVVESIGFECSNGCCCWSILFPRVGERRGDVGGKSSSSTRDIVLLDRFDDNADDDDNPEKVSLAAAKVSFFFTKQSFSS
mmetsp:Transcript_28595/g.45953  ORF Transcript_28595/g.45953 Transcript_28595/m.45953 type:complete len:275 (-) Transcript_28595:532-1356(-)